MKAPQLHSKHIRLSNFPKDKRLENPSLSLIVGRILLLCIASIKKRRQCAQNWTFDNTGNTIVFVIESQVAGTKNHLNTPGMADPNLLSPSAIPENNCHFLAACTPLLSLFLD